MIKIFHSKSKLNYDTQPDLLWLYISCRM